MEIIQGEELIAILGKSLAICISDDFEYAIISPNSNTIKKDMEIKKEIEIYELLLDEKVNILKETITKEIKKNIKKQHYCKLSEKKEFLNEINNFLDLNIKIEWW